MTIDESTRARLRDLHAEHSLCGVADCGGLDFYRTHFPRLLDALDAATARAEAAERDAAEMRTLLREIRDQRAHDGGCASHCILDASDRPERIAALAKEKP